MPKHHLIFEGCELSGKSFLMSQVYDYLEKKHNSSKNLLNGCHWINCDVGIFGGPNSKPIINQYIEIIKNLKNENVILEKFHISDIIYQKMYNKKNVNYQKEEQLLQKLNTKIVFLKVSPSEKLFAQRLKDRLALYPHYKRIAKKPSWYIKQQEEYVKTIKETNLPYLEIDTTKLPNNNWRKILPWIGEK
ncbi:hypothetical protein CL633_00020 [bacterium]|nr:hypothetical protein [bacterium]|tara:strand:+ start:4114 stop:4683 length:570 start_codon:yes stop_codon:yes gene_type:complete